MYGITIFGYKCCDICLTYFSIFVRYNNSIWFLNGCKVYSAFLDASKAADKVLHNGLYKKLLDRKAPLCFVLLLMNWYSKVHCAVRWNGFMGEWFPILCGVRQGGVLSPYLFSVYVNDLIFELRNSGSGAHIGKLLIGCVLYADDIVLMSPSCRGLQRLVRICEQYGLKWDIKFNPCKSQVVTFGGTNPPNMHIEMASTVMQWVNKVKYLGLYFCSISGNLDVSNNVRKFYGQYNNIRTVLGYGTHEMSVVHLCKVYCLSALMYGCESWHLQNKEQSRISVAWNNCFRSIFNCCWRESVNSLSISVKFCL